MRTYEMRSLRHLNLRWKEVHHVYGITTSRYLDPRSLLPMAKSALVWACQTGGPGPGRGYLHMYTSRSRVLHGLFYSSLNFCSAIWDHMLKAWVALTSERFKCHRLFTHDPYSSSSPPSCHLRVRDSSSGCRVLSYGCPTMYVRSSITSPFVRNCVLISDFTAALDGYISHIQTFIPFLPPTVRAPSVHSLAMARFERFMRTRQRQDLEQSILHSTAAIFFPRPRDGSPPNTIQMFFSIALTLFHRARESREPEDVKYCIKYLRYLHDQPLEVFGVTPDLVTEVLIHALKIQAELDLGEMWDIEEMAILCRELLTSDISTTFPTDSIMALVRAVKAQCGGWNGFREPPEKVIECLREANRRLPNSHQLSIALACVLSNRFHITYSNDDYEEATAILDKVIASRSPGDVPNRYQDIALHMVAFLTQARSAFFGKPENAEQAIHRIRTLFGGASVDEAFRPGLIQELARLQAMRFERDSRDAQFISSYPSFRDLSESLSARSSREEPLQITAEHQHLEALLCAPRITDVADIEEAAEYCRLWLTSYPQSGLAMVAGITLGWLLLRLFSYTSKIEYLNEEISVLQDQLKTPGVERCQFMVVGLLISSITIRFGLRHHNEDFNELMRLFPLAVNDRRGSTPERFLRSCDWAQTARTFGHPSTSAAYDCAMSLIQDTLMFAPTLDVQHSRLVAMRNSYETVPLDSASHHIHEGRLQEAIETLERGRSLLWSEMRGLRTSIDQVRVVNPHLADEFKAVNKK